MNASFHSSDAAVVAAILAAGHSSAIVQPRPLPEPPVLPQAPKRRKPSGTLRFAPPTAEGLKRPAYRGAVRLPLVSSRKGRLLAQLTARQ